MHVFVAGATGVLGRRLVAELDERGHAVVGLARDDAGAAVVRERGGDPVRGDLLAPETVGAAMPDDIDAVVHAATAIPTDTRPSRSDWATNDRLRREGTETLTRVAAEAGADRYLQQSIVWVARQPDGSRFDEDSQPNPDRLAESALDGERIAAEAGDEHDYDVVTIRGGWFYSHDSAHTRQLGEGLLAGRMPVVGGGLLGRRDAELSMLHVDDAATAFAAAVEGDATGVYHVVDDEPVTFAGFLRRLAAELNAPDPRRVPGWLARLAVGKDTVRLLTSPMPTSNERFREAFDWEPSLPTYREGLAQVVERWRDAGDLRATGEGYEWTG